MGQGRTASRVFVRGSGAVERNIEGSGDWRLFYNRERFRPFRQSSENMQGYQDSPAVFLVRLSHTSRQHCRPS